MKDLDKHDLAMLAEILSAYERGNPRFFALKRRKNQFERIKDAVNREWTDASTRSARYAKKKAASKAVVDAFQSEAEALQWAKMGEG